MCRSFFISDLIKKIYIKEFPLTIANIKNTWLVRGQTHGRLHRYLPFFLIFKIEFTFFLYRCRATNQLYEKNRNDIRRRKSSCRTLGFKMLNQLSCLKSFFYFDIFTKLLLLFVLLKLIRRILFSIHSFPKIFSVYIKLSIFLFLFFFKLDLLDLKISFIQKSD